MQRIDSWQQYLDLKAEAKARGLTLSNLYFLPGQGAAEDRRRAAVLPPGPGGGRLAAFWTRAAAFYRCYYQLAPQTPCAPVQLDRDAVIELPFRGGLGPAQQPELEQIARMGFALGRGECPHGAPRRRPAGQPARPARRVCRPGTAGPAGRDHGAAGRQL